MNIKKNYLFSNQYKKAIFYAFSEAKKHKLATVTPLCLFYGLFKTKVSLNHNIFSNIFSKTNLTYLDFSSKVEELIKNESKFQSIDYSSQKILLSKSVRQIILDSILQSKSVVVKTDDVLISLLKNEKIKNLVNKVIFKV